MTRYFFNGIVLLLVLIAPQRILAQLSVVPGSTVSMTPLQFVQTYLIGQGVTVANATFNDLFSPLNSSTRPILQQDQIGSFTTASGAATELGLNGGVILSSGKVQDAITGVFPNTQTGGGSDPDLLILAASHSTTSVHDKSVLEFDFIPQTDIIRFRYVFASVEFDDFCPQGGNLFNDAFGLLLSGPGISGGSGFLNDAENIALLPSSTSFVNIANICNADYHDTTMNGIYSWWNPYPLPYFSYYRFSYVFTATHSVICGETYHMKFAIGDASDEDLDSGVFLEQNSFSSNDLMATTAFSNSQTGNLLIQNCSSADLTYHILQQKPNDIRIDLNIDPSGTATQADILPNPFPTQVIIPSGQLQTSPITIQVVPAIAGPDKTLVIIGSDSTCASTIIDTLRLTLRYNNDLSVDVPSQVICNGSSVTLTANITGGQPFLPSGEYHYLWSNSATTPSITVTPAAGHSEYTVTVTDACGASAFSTASIDAGSLPATPGAITGPTNICPPQAGVVYSIAAIPGADSYIWVVPIGASVTGGANTNTITVSFGPATVSGPITVFGKSTACGDGPSSPPFFVTMNPTPSAAGTISGPSTVCQGVTGQVFAVAPVPNATSYIWTLPSGAVITGGNNTDTITVDFDNTAISGQVSVVGHNLPCGDGLVSPLFFLNVMARPADAGPITGPVTVCQGTAGNVYSVSPIANATSYSWTVPPGVLITGGSSSNAITVSFSLTSVSGNITVTGHKAGCPDGAPSSLNVTVNNIPGTPGTITGPTPVCQGQTGVPYSASLINNATEYIWSYSGSGISSPGTTKDILLDFSSTATSGMLKVFGRNSCGDSPVISPGFQVVVNLKPTARFQECFPTKTIRNGRKIQLKGGFPLPGIYLSSEGVSLDPKTGLYVFDPSVVTGPFPKNLFITYRFQNSQGCQDEQSKSITVFDLNADIVSPMIMKDLRNDQQYTYSSYGTGANIRSWLTQNLNYGSSLQSTKFQTDNCQPEKYCPPSDPGCSGSGSGYYQWDEMMEYQVGQGFQDLCPPGWHVPASAEWQLLIDNLDPTFISPEANALTGAELKDAQKTFSALLKGMQYQNSSTWSFSSGVITGSMFWTSTPDNNSRSFARGLCDPYNTSVSTYSSNHANAFPVRCIKN